jgi:hypothetical protein
MKRFNIVRPGRDGGVVMYPMKEWLRQHPEHLPPGLDATNSTSHQLRAGLRKRGWSVAETANEVRLMMPGMQAGEAVIDAVLGEEPEDAVEDTNETSGADATFGLEYQLRDFLAQNIESIDLNGKRLRLYVDQTGRDGIEYPSPVGNIDVLAVDDSGALE